MSTDTIPFISSVTDVVTDAIKIDSCRILDVGCGAGGLVRWLAEQGARVTGLETQHDLVEAARQRQPVASEDYVEGGGEDLPFADSEFDVVIFSFSLHHVPARSMRDALGEAYRVLKPGGAVLVVEPVADGDYFALVRMIDDETEVRRLALEALRDRDAHGLAPGEERFYRMRRWFDGPDQFVARMVEVDPARQALIDDNRVELDKRFFVHGKRDEKGYCFEMEIRSNMLLKSVVEPS